MNELLNTLFYFQRLLSCMYIYIISMYINMHTAIQSNINEQCESSSYHLQKGCGIVFKMIIHILYPYELYYVRTRTTYEYTFQRRYIPIEKGELEWRRAKHNFCTLLLYQQESCGMKIHYFFKKKVFFTILRFVSHEYKTHITIPRSLCKTYFSNLCGDRTITNTSDTYIYICMYTCKNIIHIFVSQIIDNRDGKTIHIVTFLPLVAGLN